MAARDVLLIALLGGSFGWRLHAASVSVGDPSFEGNSLAAGGYTFDLGPEWLETNGPGNGAGFEHYLAGFAADGTDHLGVESGHDVWQNLGAVYHPNTRYTLRVAAGNRNHYTLAGNETRFSLAGGNGATFATGSVDASLQPAGTFADAPALVFESASAPACLGQTIRILLQGRGNGRSHFDHIRLDASPSYAPGTASVANLTVAGVAATGATLRGQVTDPGNDPPVITVFWGPVDGESTAGAWAHSVTLPGTQSGEFSAAVSGLAPGAVYFFAARASNSAGESWAQPSGDFETLALPPTVGTTAATAIGTSGATLGAEVTSTGGDVPAVTIYYGLTDGGTDPGAWAASVALGPVPAGAASAAVGGLAPGTTYHFRAYAENSGGAAWAPASLSFATAAIFPAEIANRGTTGLTGTTATLRGEVLDDGGAAPVVTVFYGPVDGGTNPLAWAASAGVGVQGGEFTRFVSGLGANTGYWFRCRAVNQGGTSWAPASEAFTTTAMVPNGAVINEFHYNPLDATSLEEFIELHNPGDTAVDLSGWALSGAVEFTFPAGTVLPVGGYRVVAENPAALQAKFALTGVLGPWLGKLGGSGETINLRDGGGVVRDSVAYQAGFPWPTAADGAGPSCELVNPGLDNDLGGAWRSSATAPTAETYYINTAATGWRYKKGTAEPSTPVDAWRALAFNDAGWTSAQTSIGYGDSDDNTVLSDMRNSYWSIYLRRAFTVPANQIPDSLTLRVYVDDGCIVWINGTEVARAHMPAGHVAYNQAAANHDASWETFTISNASAFLVGGTNVIAIQVNNSSLNSSDLSIDVDLKTGNSAGHSNPTPGKVNGARRDLAVVPPQIRQVRHSPQVPMPGQAVAVTAKITDADPLGAVSLAYQLVDPGNYIRKTDAAYSANWTSVPMLDNGSGGDELAGDFTYTAVLPAALQTNRRLVRYRITFADAAGNSLTVPYADDEQPNFAYFVYAGVPAWTGALRPTSFNGYPATSPQTYPASLLNSLPPLHLIATAADVANCQYNGTYATTRFPGTVVHEGVVHDHIQFRVRGIGSTYQSGKNKWNIYFNRARDFQARDNLGRPFEETWNNLLLNGNASPWASVNRGAAGVEEAVSNRIYEVGGLPAMRTTFLHFRVIDDAVEASAASQYEGDLWGLYLGLEPSEGNFLDERGLPDGNIYSIEGNGGDKKHQAPGQPVDSSDWTTFRDGVAAAGQSEAWYRANIDLPALYTFLGLSRLIGNVDVRPGDNYRFYHRPTDNRWVIFPYDMDMQFIAAHHWGGTMDSVVVAGAPNAIRAVMRHPALAIEYRNRCRELLDLMGSAGAANGGQIGQLIDEYAQYVNPAGQTLTWADLDAALWNLHPRTTGNGSNSGQSSHKGNFFRAYYLDGTRGGLGGTVQTGSWVRNLTDTDGDGFSDHEGLMQWFVNFATNTWPGGAWVRKATNASGAGADPDPNRQKGYGYKYLEWESLYGGFADSNNNPTQAADTAFPNTPVLSYAGAPGFPTNDLSFSCSPFADPQGAGTFATAEWRLAEIRAPGLAGFEAGDRRKYELETTYTSGEVAAATSFRFPGTAVDAGRTYRARVRHKDNSGRWGHWSLPVQFITAAAAAPEGLADKLVVSEIHYNPAPATEAEIAAGHTTQDFEFIELKNIGTAPLVLTDVGFTTGLDFTFASGTTLAPGAFVLVVKKPAAFELRYGTGLPVAGNYGTSNLSNGGERLVLSYLGSTTLRDFSYGTSAPWPTTPAGGGPSLALVRPGDNPDHSLAASWRASDVVGGTPGAPDAPATVTLSGLTHNYDGTPKAPTVTTTPPGLATEVTYDGSPAPPVATGTYQVNAVLTDPLHEGSAAGVLEILPAAQSITFAPPATWPLDGPPLELTAGAGSGLPVGFEIVAGPATLTGNELSFLAAGTVVVRASQGGDTNWLPAPPVERTIAVSADYAASHWRGEHFTPAQLADPAVSGPAADPDGDGYDNLMEYALATDPWLADLVVPPVVVGQVTSGGAQYLAVTFRRRNPNPGIGYHVEVSTDCAAWLDQAPAVIEESPVRPNGDGTETVTIRSALPVGAAAAEFVRLRVVAE